MPLVASADVMDDTNAPAPATTNLPAASANSGDGYSKGTLKPQTYMPEASTVLAAAFLVIPLVASGLRIVYKNREADRHLDGALY